MAEFCDRRHTSKWLVWAYYMRDGVKDAEFLKQNTEGTSKNMKARFPSDFYHGWSADRGDVKYSKKISKIGGVFK